MTSASIYTGPIIDSHIHLFDPRRPQGIPWPTSDSILYRPHLPENYWRLATPHNITAAIVVEASPWLADNAWLLETIRSDHRFLGFVGHLDPANQQFLAQLEPLVSETLFLGLRYGNLWGCDLLNDQTKPGFIEGLRQFAASGRSFESANPDPQLIKGLLLLSDALPQLRIIIDHLPSAQIPAEKEKAFEYDLRQLSARSNVFAKLAEIPQTDSHGLIVDPAFYQDRLALLWDSFGEDRCFFGSDCPNSDTVADFPTTLGLVKACMAHHAPGIQEKFFFHTVAHAYGLPISRTPGI